MNIQKSLRNLFALIFFLSFISLAQSSNETLNLMPVPAKMEVTNQDLKLDTNFTVIVTGNPAERIYSAASRMLRRLSQRTGIFFRQDYITPETKVDNPSMIINVKRPGKIKLREDESYQLTINNNQIN